MLAAEGSDQGRSDPFLRRSIRVFGKCVRPSGLSVRFAGSRISVGSGSFYRVCTSEKRFSCFYIEAIFPSRPVCLRERQLSPATTCHRAPVLLSSLRCSIRTASLDIYNAATLPPRFHRASTALPPRSSFSPGHPSLPESNLFFDRATPVEAAVETV